MYRKKINNFKWYELPIKWLMKLFGWGGYTSPFKIIYYTKIPSRRLIRHENTHMKQMEKDGRVKYHAVWGYYFLYGWLVQWKSAKQAYEDIPYEVEARASENIL